MIIPDPIFDVQITVHNIRDYTVWAYEAVVTVNGMPVFTRHYSDEYDTEGVTQFGHYGEQVTTTRFAHDEEDAREIVLGEFAERLKGILE